MTKGTGPMPMANELQYVRERVLLGAMERETHAIKAITATLASVTAPLSRPYPTARREEIAPVADSDKSFLRPTRCAMLVR